MSGINHVRYDHVWRPRDLHVVCLSCGGRALATKPSERESGLIVGDCSPAWNLADWKVRCEQCHTLETILAYSDLPKFYYEVIARDIRLWAWNHDHLTMLLDLLEGRPVDKHPYAWFATYARKEWLVRGARRHLAKAIRKQRLGGDTAR